MNNSRRKRINNSILSIEDAKAKLELVLSEEQKALAKVPDNDEENDYDDMRYGMEEIISGLEDTLSSLEDALDTLNNSDF